MQQATVAPLRVVLADDHPILLAGLQTLVSADRDLQIVGVASDGRVALQLSLDLRPDVVVLDVSMPEMNGIEVTKALRAAWPQCRILVLTMHDDPAYVRELLAVGAAGFLLKSSAPEELTRAIRAVHAGGLYLDPLIAAHAVAGLGDAGNAASPPDRAELSPREAEVLGEVARGYSNKEIGARCQISVKTVETYRARGMEKLELRSRADLVRYAAEHGWLVNG